MRVTDTRFEQIESLFNAALEKQPSERARFLEEACAGDDKLRKQVESVLRHAEVTDALDSTETGPPRNAQAFSPKRNESPVAVGTRIGRHEILALIGKGGMGEVFRARDTDLDREVAIKILPRFFAADSDQAQRFRREARLLASLNHPNIASIYSIEEFDGNRALVLELVPGETLKERLSRGALPVSEALAITAQIADALETAHAKGILHRDLKPANIKITPDGMVNVLDFGLAKAVTTGGGSDPSDGLTITWAGTEAGIVLGTPRYMSPEQARGQTVDERTDVWSFGSILYEMLVGTPAFQGEGAADILRDVLGREPRWEALPDGLDPRIHGVLRRCLEKDPENRPADMGVLGIQIAAIAASLDETKTPADFVRPLPRRSRRRYSTATATLRRNLPLLPWWMYVFVASILAIQMLATYLIVWGPSDLEGLEANFDDGVMRVEGVASDALLFQAGLRPGDRVLSVDDRTVGGTSDWAAVNANHEVGRTQTWEILRGGQRLQIQFTPREATWENRLANGYLQYVARVLSGLVLGILIIFLRPRDPTARLGAWLILTVSIVYGLPNGWAQAWRQIPGVFEVLLWIPTLSRFLVEGIFLSFFVVFPKRLFRSRWPWIVIWLPVLATLPWRVFDFNATIRMFESSPSTPEWVSQAAFLRTPLYLVAGFAILVIGYYRLTDVNLRRRVRVLMLGAAISLAGAFGRFWSANVWGFGLAEGGLLFQALVVPADVALQIALGYAIVRHRILDISVIIRQGLQYALARGVILALVPILAGILVIDMLANSQQSLAGILQNRGWAYAGLSGLVFAAHWRRKSWLKTLDRRFFREQYDAQQVLRQVVREIREAGTIERVLPRTLAQIETSLHPEFVSVMVRAAEEPDYSSLASLPSGLAPPPLSADSKLVGLARLLDQPLEVLAADTHWLEGQLPGKEVEFIQRADIDLLVPIATTPGQTEALLVLGVKRSEEPYTREDQELLETIAAGLALLVDQSSLIERAPAEGFGECPECGVCYDSADGTCPHDDSNLKLLRFPRTLVGRYRLDCRRGSGGMGKVYEAKDKALDRRVAVKVIREDWVGSAEAEERFRSEARAAAGFAHPNVVTVHDYGVEAGVGGFLVMELLAGVTLKEELNRRQRLTPFQTIEILRDVCAAVDAAHRIRLVHRDLKPENIFLTDDDTESHRTVKVLDFGVARFMPPRQDPEATVSTLGMVAGRFVGTPAYASPEQVAGESPDIAWDVWALSVIAYEVLTGARPFAVIPSREWRDDLAGGRFTPIRQQSFFEWCFAAKSMERPRSAREFLRELETLGGD